MDTQVDFWVESPSRAAAPRHALDVNAAAMACLNTYVPESLHVLLQDFEPKRPPIQKTVPALDEAQKILEDFAKEVPDADMQDAVAKQLEAHIEILYIARIIYIYIHIYIWARSCQFFCPWPGAGGHSLGNGTGQG